MTLAGAEADHDAVIHVLHDLSEAIASGDPGAVTRLFTSSDDVVMFGSEKPETAHGEKELHDLWTRVLGRDQRYQWSWSDETVTTSGNVAWLAAKAVVVIDDDHGQRQVPYRATMVLTRQPDGWRIAQYHGSEPADTW